MRTFFAFVLLFCHSAFTQETGLYQIAPQWKNGDERIVRTESKSVMYVSDTIFSETTMKNDYKITVKEAKKYYELNYTQISDNLGFEYSGFGDSAPNVFLDIMRKIEDKVKGFDYRVIVDKETGLAIKIKNEKEFQKWMNKMVQEVLKDVFLQENQSKENLMQMEKNVNTYFKTIAPKINQSVINSVNYLFQAHAYNFPINAKISEETLVYDINAMGHFGTTEFPAIQTVESIENEHELILNVSREYDKEFLLEQMQKKSPSIDFTTEDFLISETEEIIFDLESSWIKRHESNVYFEIPQIRFIENSVITFR